MQGCPQICLALALVAAGCNGEPGAPDGATEDADLDADAGDVEDEEDEAPCPADMILVDDDAGTPFCIDRYEHPNIAGQMPTVGVAWFSAREACVEDSKEMCLEEQWERACVGTPATECVGDVGLIGEREGCASDLGVADMGGNVAEWTASPGGSVTFWVRGGSGRDAVVGCEAREELEAELRGSDLGVRCCKRVR